MTTQAYNDRDGLIWYNGDFVPWRDANVHVLTHGLHYASSVFEGERMYGGEIFKLTEHSERLANSARMLGFDIPWRIEEIDQACIDACRVNGIVDGYVRPVAWRGSEMMGVSAQNNRIHLAIAAWTWPSYFAAEAKMKGIRMKTGAWRRPAPDTAPVHAKAAGLYMICTMAKHAVEADGFDEALMLDYRGRVAEATSANIFFLMADGRLHTPEPDCFLNGITRQTVIDLAAQLGIEVVERVILPEELGKASEVFLTGTAAEITPVGAIDEHRYCPGEITFALAEAYDKATGKSPSLAAVSVA